MLCLKVPKHEGEKVRNKLLEKNLLFKEAKISSEDDSLLIPVKEDPGNEFDYPLLDRDLDIRDKKETDYTEIADVPDDLKHDLPSSYEIIGDIAVIKVRDPLQSYKKEIGSAILQAHKNVNSVLEDEGVTGEYRVRKVNNIAGEAKTKTVHKEYGAEFKVDVSRAYFSPRLATERWRVVQQVKKNETIFDMFAGVGPYSILIAKNKDVEKIHSVDINPEAFILLKKNIERNNVKERVIPYQGDARDFTANIKVDRVIMNLPHSSKEFIDSAIESVGEEAVINFYEIIEEEDIENSKNEIIEKIRSKGHHAEIMDSKKVRTYSATMDHMAYDIKVEKSHSS
ncbi:MAG: class I SAM-dependent methyltransferase [Thermoplasmata archaeon]